MKKNGYYVLKREHERLSDLILALDSFEAKYCNWPSIRGRYSDDSINIENFYDDIANVHNHIVNVQLEILEKMKWCDKDNEN